MQNSASNTFSTALLTNGQTVTVELTSNATCASPTLATSSTYTASVTGGVTYYKDADNDGYSDGTTQTACSAPAGYKIAASLTALSGDCDDNNAALNPATEWFLDADNDNYYTGSAVVQCISPGVNYRRTGLVAGGDCNDGNAAINPGATEICANGIDDNCDGNIDESCVYVWLGAHSEDWNEAANWDPAGIPNNALLHSVLISAGTLYSPILPAGNNIQLRSGRIEGGSTLSIAVGSTITTFDTFMVSSVCPCAVGQTPPCCPARANIRGAGTFVMSGSVMVGKADFEANLQISNVAGVALHGGAGTDIRVANALQLRSGTLDVTDGSLTFLSPDENTSAYLDNFSPGFNGTIVGSIKAQRGYAEASEPSLHKQHFFGSPITNLPVTQLAPAKGTNGVAVTPKANCDEMTTQTGSNYGNVFEYDESKVSTCHVEGWVVRSSGNTVPGKGYSVVKQGAGVMTVTGETNLADYTVSGLSNHGWISPQTPQGNTYFAGSHLLSNPYMASLDLDRNANPDFDNVIQVLHTTGTHAGTFQPLEMSSADVVAPFQGFYVKKSLADYGAAPATFTIKSTDRKATGATFQKTGSHQMALEVIGNGFADVTYFNFRPGATDSYDPDYDGGKMPSFNGQPTLYSIIGAEWASINSNADVQSTPFIPLGFVPGANGTFMFQGTGFDEIPNTTVYIEDKKLNLMHNLTAIPDYTFVSGKSDNRERFMLHFNYEQPSAIGAVDNAGFKIYPNPASGIVWIESETKENFTIEIYDMAGRKIDAPVHKTFSGSGALDISMLASAVYQVKITGSKSAIVKRLLKE